MANSDPSPVTQWRRRRQRQGFVRVEVQVRKEDAALVRDIAGALGDPARQAGTRAILRETIAPPRGGGLKALLARAPLEGIDLERPARLRPRYLPVSFLIDTNVVSEVRKGERCDPAVAAWWAGVAEDDLRVSVLVLGEIRKGVELARRRDPQKAAVLEAWLTELVSDYSDRILPVDAAVGRGMGTHCRDPSCAGDRRAAGRNGQGQRSHPGDAERGRCRGARCKRAESLRAAMKASPRVNGGAKAEARKPVRGSLAAAASAGAGRAAVSLTLAL